MEKYEEIGVVVYADGTIENFEGTLICDTFFQVSKHIEVTDFRESSFEIKLVPIKASQKLKSINIRMEELKNDNWITRNYGGTVWVNRNISRVYTIIRQIIESQLKDMPLSKEVNSLGWNGSLSNGFAVGNEILKGKGSDIIRLNGKVRNESPHTALKELSLHAEFLDENGALEFIQNVYLKTTQTNFISLTTLLVTLLSNITSLLKEGNEKPNFVTVFRGMSGSRKSSWMIAGMHLLSKYNGQILVNFTGTVAGIVHESSRINDFVFTVDDLYPCEKKVHDRMVNVFTTLIRVYGDNAERVTFGKPQNSVNNMLAITCEELPNQLAPSDYARLLVLTFDKDTIDLDRLTELQNGYKIRNAFIRHFVNHIADIGEDYIKNISTAFKRFQIDVRTCEPTLLGRHQSTAAWLCAQYEMLLNYECKLNILNKEQIQMKTREYKMMLIEHLMGQNKEFGGIDPSRLYFQSIINALNSNEMKVYNVDLNGNRHVATVDIKKNKGNGTGIQYPKDFMGFKLNGDYYLNHQASYSVFKAYCEKCNIPISFSQRRILSILKKNGLIEKTENQESNTVRLKVNDIQHRLIKVSGDTFSKFLKEEYEDEM